MNTAIADHALKGSVLIYRPFDKPYVADDDHEDGTLIVGAGFELLVLEVFKNWNNVEDLTMLYVYVPATGYRTHLSDTECGMAVL